MPTQIKEIIVITRSSIEIPFFPLDSIYWFDTDPNQCQATQYFTEKYVNTGKAIQSTNYPLISEDGLIIAYEAIFNDFLYLKEICEDQRIIDDAKIRGAYNRTNGIFVQEHYYSMDTNNPINFKSLV
jgi:hypothetical protein